MKHVRVASKLTKFDPCFTLYSDTVMMYLSSYKGDTALDKVMEDNDICSEWTLDEFRRYFPVQAEELGI